jgi:hypothetical protein
MKKNENSLTISKPALIKICQEGGTRTTNPANRTPMILQKYSRSSTPAGHVLSRDMGCRLLDNGSADAPAIMPFTSPFSTQNSTNGLIPPLKTLTVYLPLIIPGGILTSATILAYSYNGREAAATFSTKTTTNRCRVAWKQQPEEGVVLRSITMPIKNFFLSSSLAPARSSLYLRPAYSSSMTLNCTSPVLDPTPSTVLNCNLGHLGHLGNICDLGHLGHLGYLGNIGNLNTLDHYPLDPTPTDSLPGAFITEMDPTDPGPSEGCYADDSLDPLHTRTLETADTSQTPRREYHTRQIDALDGHGPISGILIDALDGHGSLSEMEPT